MATKNVREQVEEQVVLNLREIVNMTKDSHTALRMLAELYDVNLGADE